MPDEQPKISQQSNVNAFSTYEFFQDSNYDFYTAGQNAAPQTPQSPAALPSAEPQLLAYDCVDSAPWATPEESCPRNIAGLKADSEDDFSGNFNFEASLLKIFWRIDVDRNNHVSYSELTQAIESDWFAGDEKLLAKVLLACYDDITMGSLRLDAGVTVDQILRFGPFAEIIASQCSG
jgi:hypothetical protein